MLAYGRRRSLFDPFRRCDAFGVQAHLQAGITWKTGGVEV